MAGFIYIMSNPAFPNLLKIGKSKKDPKTDRVNELNQTGVPEPFKVEYYAFVEDEDFLERVVHQELDQKRPNKNREFFDVKIHEAINTIRYLAIQNSAMKYDEVNSEYDPSGKVKHTGLGLWLNKHLKQLKTEYIRREEQALNQALKVLIPLLAVIIILGFLFG